MKSIYLSVGQIGSQIVENNLIGLMRIHMTFSAVGQKDDTELGFFMTC